MSLPFFGTANLHFHVQQGLFRTPGALNLSHHCMMTLAGELPALPAVAGHAGWGVAQLPVIDACDAIA